MCTAAEGVAGIGEGFGRQGDDLPCRQTPTIPRRNQYTLVWGTKPLVVVVIAKKWVSVYNIQNRSRQPTSNRDRLIHQNYVSRDQHSNELLEL